jgi:pilus assembly protein CpaB
MRDSTIATLLGAAVCAAAAALLAVSWFAGGSSRDTAIAKSAEPLPTVVVANAPLKVGTVLSAEVVDEVTWPTAPVPPGAFASKSALLGGGQRVVLAPIATLEPILPSKITGPGQRASLSIMIGEGKKAVTIRVDDVLGVAGFVQPDDRVDVLLTRNEQNGAAGQLGTALPYTDLLLQNVRVLAVDQISDRQTPAKPARAVTLEVDTPDAQKLVLGASIGQLSLALRRVGWSQIGEARRVGLDDLPRSATVEGQPAMRSEAPADRGPTVTVFRGASERKQYDVSADAKGPISEVVGFGTELVQGADTSLGLRRGDGAPADDRPR